MDAITWADQRSLRPSEAAGRRMISLRAGAAAPRSVAPPSHS
jgi:hypothetical protein